MKKRRIISSLIVLTLVASPLLLVLSGCGGGDGGDGVAKNSHFAAAWTTTNYLDDTYGVLMAADNGESLFAKVDTTDEGMDARVPYIVYQNASGGMAVIFMSYDGLPMYLVDSDYVFQFLNYTETTVDVYRMGRDGVDHSFPKLADSTLKNRPSEIAGVIEGVKQTVALDGDMQAMLRAAEEADDGSDIYDPNKDPGLSFDQIITAAKFGLSAVGCGAAITVSAPTIAGGIAVAAACGSLLLDMLDEMGFDVKPAFLEDVETVMNVAGCLGKDVGDCASLFIQAVEIGFENAEDFLAWFNQRTGRAVTPGSYSASANRYGTGSCDYEFRPLGSARVSAFDGGFRVSVNSYVFTQRYSGQWHASGGVRSVSYCEVPFYFDDTGELDRTERWSESNYSGTSSSFGQGNISFSTFTESSCGKYGTSCPSKETFYFSR